MEENRITNNGENLIDIFELLNSFWKKVRKNWWIILLVLILCAAGNTVREKLHYRETYEASASFAVTTGGREYSSITSYYNRITMEQLNTTFPYIITSGILSDIVAEDLGMEYVPGTITASVLQETNLFQLKVVAAEPELAYDILQSVIENYPSVAKYVIGDTSLTLIDETGVPEQPMYEPGYKGAAIKGAFIGGVLCCAVMLLQIFLSNTIKSQEDLKKIMNIKHLAGIPKERIKKRSKKNSGRVMLDNETITPVFRESIHTLQIRMARILEEKKLKTIVVTSTLAGEGKTTVSCNLAYAMAEKGYKVLLLDGDFRNPSVAAMLQLPVTEKEISDVILGNADAKEVIQQYQDTSLWVLPGMKPQENSSRLYRNGGLEELVRSYSKEMDLIIIDTPPCGIMNDAVLAADLAEGIMLVIRQDYANSKKIMDGVEMLSSSNAELLGCVINGEDISGNGYGKYGYGKYGYGRYGYGRYGYGRYGYGERTRD